MSTCNLSISALVWMLLIQVSGGRYNSSSVPDAPLTVSNILPQRTIKQNRGPICRIAEQLQSVRSTTYFRLDWWARSRPEISWLELCLSKAKASQIIIRAGVCVCVPNVDNCWRGSENRRNCDIRIVNRPFNTQAPENGFLSKILPSVSTKSYEPILLYAICAQESLAVFAY